MPTPPEIQYDAVTAIHTYTWPDFIRVHAMKLKHDTWEPLTPGAELWLLMQLDMPHEVLP